MKSFSSLLLLFFIYSITFSSCTKYDWMNPYDAGCPKTLFTPSNPSAEIQGNSVKLTWNQVNQNISGYILYRSSDNEPITALAQVQKTIKEYIDISVAPGKKYTYYILSQAGSNISDTSIVSITPIFPPTVSTGEIYDFSVDTIRLEISGEVISDGGTSITAQGICWSTSPEPTVNNSKTIESNGVGNFVSTLSGLQFGTKYYARAYAQNSHGISYGTEVNFITIGAPIVKTVVLSNLTSTTVTSGGIIENDGGSPITARGVCWSLSPNPTISNSKTVDGSGIGSYATTITGLQSSTTYYLRAYATNKYTTTYGDVLVFTTKPQTQENSKGQFMPYVNFNGANTYVNVGQTDIATKIGSSNFTMEGWVKSTSTNNQPQTIFSSGADAWGWWDFQIRLENSRIVFTFRNGANLTISSDFPNDTLWHHFALVHENKIASVIYIDGAQTIRSNNIGMVLGSSPNVSIGASLDGSAVPSSFFKGGIRQIRVSKGSVYNSNFTPLFDATTNSTTVAFWDLGEGSGNSINANINSYNGTLINGKWINN